MVSAPNRAPPTVPVALAVEPRSPAPIAAPAPAPVEGNPRAAARNADGFAACTACAPAGVSRVSEASPDGLKTWDQLSPARQGLFGADGQAGYEGLDTKQRGVFLVLTERLEQNGVSLEGLELDGGAGGVNGNMFRFELKFGPESAALLKERVGAAIDEGKFYSEAPSAKFHKGYLDSGVREERAKYALQIGFGEDGAFVDMDRYNPTRGGKMNYYRHLLEIATPGNIDPKKAGSDLGMDIFA